MPKCVVIALLVLVCAFPAAAQSKKAKNTLKLLLSVDGAGSGLDADTVRGATPDSIVATALAAAITHIRDTDYGVASGVTIPPGFCDCATIGCNGDDFRINCSGGLLPFPGVQGAVSYVGVEPGSANQCTACGCNNSGTTAELGVGAICVGAP